MEATVAIMSLTHPLKPFLRLDAQSVAIAVPRTQALTPFVRVNASLHDNVLTGMMLILDNFMDVSDNDCMTEFTTGQTKRLRAQIAMFRGL